MYTGLVVVLALPGWTGRAFPAILLSFPSFTR